MNIWLVNHYASPPSGAGGTRHHSFAANLMRHGHEVLVVAANYSHVTFETRSVDSRTGCRVSEECGVKYLWIQTPPYRGNSPTRLWNMVVFSWRFSGAVRHAGVAKPDVIVGSSVHPFAALAAERYARKHQVPFVFEVRDLWPQTLLDMGSFKKGHPFIVLLDWIETYLYRNAHKIVTVLPFGAEYMKRKGVPVEKVVWIPNGVDFKIAPSPVPPPGTRPFVMLFAGQLVNQSGVNVLLEVAAELKAQGWQDRILFRIYGFGVDRELLQKQARRDGLTNVEFKNPISKTEIYAELTKAHAFYLYIADSPLYQWGFSTNKLFDYFAVARPILCASSTHYNPVGDAKAGIVVHPKDLAGMVEALKRLSELPEAERWEMGKNGRQYAEANHDMILLTTRLESALAMAIKNGKAQRRN
jgi:glycosyltransferase involved in cell wall biosynthesis